MASLLSVVRFCIFIWFYDELYILGLYWLYIIGNRATVAETIWELFRGCCWTSQWCQGWPHCDSLYSFPRDCKMAASAPAITSACKVEGLGRDGVCLTFSLHLESPRFPKTSFLGHCYNRLPPMCHWPELCHIPTGMGWERMGKLNACFLRLYHRGRKGRTVAWNGC